MAHERTAEDPYLDAARECVLAVGVRRTTLTDVARRAGVSRMTLYRRWPDMGTLLADLMTREWAATAREMAALVAGTDATTPSRVARTVVRAGVALQENPLFQKILDVDPELLLPYLLHRRGRTQDATLAVIVEMLSQGQLEGSVRAADVDGLARVVLLSAQSFVLSAPTMTDALSLDQLSDELGLLLERYLAP